MMHAEQFLLGNAVQGSVLFGMLERLRWKVLPDQENLTRSEQGLWRQPGWVRLQLQGVPPG